MIVYGPNPHPRHTIGGKATGLYNIQKTALAVPPFLVITAETFDPLLRALPANAPAAECRAALLTFILSETDRTAMDRILAGWLFPGRAVVVRSSIADEDGKQHAFAGLMDSFLNLTSFSSVNDAIARCAASAYSERACAYRHQKGLPAAARPAVIVQQQISAVASGVLFTTFPEYPQEMAAHATLSFGEALMQGSAEADEFCWLKASGNLHRTVIATKTHQLQAGPEPGLHPVAVALEKQALPCLAPDQLQALFRMGTQLEKDFGQPQDVEFVVTADALFVVQSRPITQPIPVVIVYDNANIQESYCGVTTPLTFSFTSRAYATVYRQTMQTLGLSAAQIWAHEGVITQLLGLVKGRIYYNINNWYRGLQLLPSFGQNKADMERMMGLEEPVDFVQDSPKSLRQKLNMLPGLLLNLGRLVGAFHTLGKRVPAFHRQFAHHYRAFYAQPLADLSITEILSRKEQLDRVLLGNWATPIINDFYVMMMNGKAVRNLKKAGIAQPDEFLSRYLSGDSQIASTQPVRAMRHLAAQARKLAELRALILASPPLLHQQVQHAFPDFYRSVSQFIDQYGDRTVGELKLETMTMRLEPAVFYQYLRNYLTTDDIISPLAEGNATNLHISAAAELTARLAKKNRLFRQKVGRNLAKLQQAIRYREALRLERTRLFGMYRALYIALGQQLANRQVLATARDVFYLTEDEILRAAGQQPGIAHTLTPLVASRRAEFAQYETEDVPGRVVVPSPPITQEPMPPDRADQLRGTGCVAGVATGPALVITDPRDSLNVTGHIVCALRTDPGWAVLFPACRAVLIERGSSLSHSVILLRELGLPTIINIPGLTKRVQTGQRLTIDGLSGVISLPTDPPTP